MKYRVTKRGWFVFSTLGIIVLYCIFILLTPLGSEDRNTVDQEPQVAGQGVSEDQGSIGGQTDEVENASPKDEGIDLEEEDQDSEEETDIDQEIELEVEEEIETTQTREEVEGDETDVEPAIPMSHQDTLYFEKNVADFKDVHKTTLEPWVAWLVSDERLMVVVEGHINGYPDYFNTPYGLELSEKRGQVIKDYLVEAGIDASRIRIKNMGTNDQITKTDDVSQHYLNRRSVIYFQRP